MKAFVVLDVPEGNHSKRERLLQMYSWCASNFGESTRKTWVLFVLKGLEYQNWNIFRFYDEKMATWFVLQFGEYIMSEEQYLEQVKK